MTTEQLKEALIEVSNMCAGIKSCGSAKRRLFWCETTKCCSLDHHFPENWDIEEWKENKNDQTD